MLTVFLNTVTKQKFRVYQFCRTSFILLSGNPTKFSLSRSQYSGYNKQVRRFLLVVTLKAEKRRKANGSKRPHKLGEGLWGVILHILNPKPFICLPEIKRKQRTGVYLSSSIKHRAQNHCAWGSSRFLISPFSPVIFFCSFLRQTSKPRSRCSCSLIAFDLILCAIFSLIFPVQKEICSTISLRIVNVFHV